MSKIAAVCVTYNRPECLRNILRCFLDQDHPDCELVILDDLGQYFNQSALQPGKRWRVVSVSRRFRTLGEKRNAANALVSPDVERIAVWDDDDHYFPWALSAVDKALDRGEFVQPRHALEVEDGRLVSQETFNRRCDWGFAYHGCWGYTRDFVLRMGGYPCVPHGVDDQTFQLRAHKAGVRSVDVTCPRPFYVYNRSGDRISEKRDGGNYAAMAADDWHFVGDLAPADRPRWEPQDAPERTPARERKW